MYVHTLTDWRGLMPRGLSHFDGSGKGGVDREKETTAKGTTKRCLKKERDSQTEERN